MPDLSSLAPHVEVGLNHFLGLGAILFTIGVMGVIFRRNALIMFMSVELMLTGVNLSLIAFSRAMNDLNGHVFVLFIFAVAAAEAGVGLAILVEIFRKRDSVDVDEFRQLME
jgi:NADH-quinone oxidoreductase subunit K